MKIKLLLIFSLFYLQLSAQNFPTDYRIALTVESLDMVQKMTMPALDNQTLLDEELQRRGPGIAPKYAENMQVDITPDTHGNWEDLSDGNSVWRMKIKSAGAKSLNLGFSKYLMPNGGTLILYTPNYERVMGPFTPADNEEHEQLWTPVLDGDELVIEVQLPTSEKSNLQLELSYVNHDFLGFTTMGSAIISGSCNLDVICGAVDGWGIVDDYRDIIQSVAVIGTGGGTFCTGFLVNNANNDCRPFFMTADHCGITSGSAASLVTYWNFFNSTCREPGSGASGGNGDGSLADFNTGAIFRAAWSLSDMTLVELDDPVSETADAFFAGWDASFTPATDTVIGIHHPSTDEKRISFDFDEAFAADGFSTTPNPNGDHFTVADWDIGTTEPGSSGSPLFNAQKQVIGQLHGGGAACGNDSYDTYGWFHTSWEGGGTSATRLKDWLDPDNTGTLVIDGHSQQQCNFFVEGTPSSIEVCTPDDAVYTVSATENFIGDVTLSVTNVPAGVTATFAENPIAPGASTTLTLTDTNAIAAGTYTLNLEGTDGANSNANMLTLMTFADVPAPSVLQIPMLGASDILTSPIFEWEAESGVLYDIEISTTDDFMNTVAFANDITDGMYQGEGLTTSTMYFWRVKGSNLCGDGNFSSTHFFTTANIFCGPNVATDIPVEISDGPANIITSTLEVMTSGLIDDLNIFDLNIDHTYIGDLAVTLTSPEGTTIELVSFQGEGCDQDDVALSFDDDATTPYATLESLCDAASPAAGGTFQPLQALSAFNGEIAQGVWTLTVEDAAGADGGALTSWNLDICSLVADDFSFAPSPSTIESCINDMATFTIAIGGAFDDNGVMLSANNLPMGATASFSQNPAAAGSVVTVTLANVSQAGGFSIEIIGDDGVNIPVEAGLIWNINGLPAESTAVNPANNAMDQPISGLVIEWDDISGATGYDFTLATDPDFNNIVISAFSTDNQFDNFGSLEYGTTYFWMVITFNDCGETTSEVFSFTTFPDLTVSLSPDDQTLCSGDNGAFNLEIGAGFETATITANNLPGSATINYSMNPAPGGTTVTATLGNLVTVLEGTYTIDFTIEDDNGTTNESATITVETPPAIPVLELPGNGAGMIAVSGINFNWEAIAGTSGYFVEISLNEDFTDVVESGNVAFNNYFSQNELDNETLYFWRITANNPCGGSVSLVFNFTTEMLDSTHEIQGVELTLQPNPTRNFVNVSLSAPLNEMIAIDVYAINGQLLQTAVFNGNATQHQIDLSSYSAGVYLVKLLAGNEVIVERIVLEK
ncbi:MAG: subtilisin-like proprotein convertase family protein [Saprospiraceae bacterium]|jgi:subtilisin-like proprotein convertase family protein